MGFGFGKFWAAGPFGMNKNVAARTKENSSGRVKKKKSGSIRSSSMDTSKSIESNLTNGSHSKSSNVQLVEAWMKAWQDKDFDLIVSTSVDNCEYLVPIGEDTTECMKVDLKDFIAQMEVTYASFPDYTTEWDEMKDGGKGKSSNTVRIKNFVSKGTHTGEPFAFGPYPPMPAKGKKIRDHPVDILVYIEKKSQKVEKIRLVSKPNQTTGPAMYYLQVGGYIP
ncbi:MAG: hypothetical protein SGILL_009215 [Bacillariaceae sp.]